jgi:hypothetical protein
VDLSQVQLDDETRAAGNPQDAGGIVLGWMTKLAVVSALVGVVGFDGISVGLAHLNTQDDADSAVQAASQSYLQSHNVQAAYDAAVKAVKPTEEVGTSDFTIAPDGTTTLSLTNTAHTLLLYRSKSTGKWAAVKVHATGKYTGS